MTRAVIIDGLEVDIWEEDYYEDFQVMAEPSLYATPAPEQEGYSGEVDFDLYPTAQAMQTTDSPNPRVTFTPGVSYLFEKIIIICVVLLVVIFAGLSML